MAGTGSNGHSGNNGAHADAQVTGDRIYFFDTTLRDGEQSPGCTMVRAEKLRMAQQLASLGVDIIEAGFPVSSQGDYDSVCEIARTVRGPVITALARCRAEDIEWAARSIEAAEKQRLHVFLSTSDLHLQAKLRMTRQQALDHIPESVRLAKRYCDDVEFSPEDATRSDPAFLTQAVAVAVEAGATTINIPDTVGYTTPAEYKATFEMLRANVPGIDAVVLSTHCHDDLGMAVANSLAGIEGGARQVECTINGIGERAGNAALEEIAAALMVRHDRYPFTNAIQMNLLHAASQLLAECISFGCSPNKAVVGSNAFAHESGIHQHGMLVNPLTYEIMTPESVGAGHTHLVLGKHSGRRALEHRLSEMGYILSPEELRSVYLAFIALADRKKSVYHQDLLGLLKEVHSQEISRVH